VPCLTLEIVAGLVAAVAGVVAAQACLLHWQRPLGATCALVHTRAPAVCVRVCVCVCVCVCVRKRERKDMCV